MNHSISGPEKAAAPSEFELEHFLPYRLSLLTNTVSQGIASGYREQHDISVTEWRILAVLGRFPGLAAKEIAQSTAMDKVAVSRAVKTLVQKNLLERVVDPSDRRRKSLHITREKGRKLLEKVIPLAKNYEQQLLDALTAGEKAALFVTLEKLQSKAAHLKT